MAAVTTKKTCSVIVDQARTTVRRDFSPFGSAIFLWCLVRITLLRSCQSISFRLRSALRCGRSRRHIFLLLKWFTPVLWVTVLLHHSVSVELQMAGRRPYILLQNFLIISLTYFAASMRLWCWYCMLSFSTYCFLLVCFFGNRTFWHWAEEHPGVLLQASYGILHKQMFSYLFDIVIMCCFALCRISPVLHCHLNQVQQLVLELNYFK